MISVNILAALTAAAVVSLTGSQSEVVNDPCPTATQTLRKNATVTDSLTGGPDVFRVENVQEGDSIVLSAAGQPQGAQQSQEQERGQEQEREWEQQQPQGTQGLTLTILKQDDEAGEGAESADVAVARECSEVESSTSGSHKFGEAGTFFVKVEQGGQRDMGAAVRYTIQLKSGNSGMPRDN